EAAFIQTEVGGGHVNRNVSAGHLSAKLVSELALFVFSIEMLIVLGSVIAFAEFQIDARTVDFDLNATITAVAQRIVALVAEHVIDRSILLHAIKYLAEVVGVQEGLASGIAGEGNQRFLAGKILVKLIAYCRA